MSDATQDVALWGAKRIAAELQVSQAIVRALAKRPDVPIFKPPGSSRICAFRDELRAWMRTKQQ